MKARLFASPAPAARVITGVVPTTPGEGAVTGTRTLSVRPPTKVTLSTRWVVALITLDAIVTVAAGLVGSGRTVPTAVEVRMKTLPVASTPFGTTAVTARTAPVTGLTIGSPTAWAWASPPLATRSTPDTTRVAPRVLSRFNMVVDLRDRLRPLSDRAGPTFAVSGARASFCLRLDMDSPGC